MVHGRSEMLCLALLLALLHTSAAKRECTIKTYLNTSQETNLNSTTFSCGSGDVLEVVSATISIEPCASDQTVKSFFESECSGEEKCTVNVEPYKNCAAVVEMKCETSKASKTVTYFVLALVFCIILAMGTTCKFEDAKEIWINKKRAFLCGWASQFGFMPLFAYCMALAFDFDPLVSVGVVLCGAAPGGTTSNLFTYWSGGNVSLSIAMSLASTACAVFMLPLLTEIYIMTTFTDTLEDGASVEIPFSDIVVIAVVTILLPVTLGALIRKHNTKCKVCGKFIYKWVEIVGSTLGGLFLVAAVIAGIGDNPDLMKPSVYSGEWALAAIFQPVGCMFGLCAATAMGLDGRDRITVALETGVQNYTLVIAICSLSYSGCTKVESLTFVFICSVWYVISSAWVVSLLRTARKKGWWHLDDDGEVLIGKGGGKGADDVEEGIKDQSAADQNVELASM